MNDGRFRENFDEGVSIKKITGESTKSPASIAVAATWDKELMYECSAVDEGQHKGLRVRGKRSPLLLLLQIAENGWNRSF